MTLSMASNLQGSFTPTRKDQPYRRGYVACVGCRTRKVRCVLDNEPPCAKCRREHRECIFQNTRKTGKHREVPKWTQAQSNVSSASEDQSHGEPTLQTSTHNSADETSRARSNQTSFDNDQHGFEEHNPSVPSLTHRVMSSILVRPSDALDVLFDAARPGQSSLRQPPSLQTRLPGPSSLVSPGKNNTAFSFVSESGQVSVSGLSQPSEEVLDLWDKCRFVRQGWFTAQEAVTYLDLFSQYLAPLSPVLAQDFCSHQNHEYLVKEEPMLCCTLLVISSRFFILPGAGGVSRNHFIHHRLWQHCELLIRRIMFGQEKLSTAKTRVVGSIESLMLISDWQPRSVHFAPETDGWDGALISPDYDRRNRLQTNGDEPLTRWREDVFEPAKRSERMSWMLLGAAVNLAYELGMFSDGPSRPSSSLDKQQNARVYRARKLLYIYVTQMASWIGCSSLLPQNISFTASESFQANDPTERPWESYMTLWVDLTRLVKTASAMFFQSGPYVKQQLLSGNYNILLQHFAPSLDNWHNQFISHSSGIPEALKSLLLIEYHYLKAYTSALSIQAVVERALSRGIGRFGDLDGDGLESFVLPQDQKFIHDVVSDSEAVLELATAIHSEGRLRYAPSRTLVCITSSSIFLLKAICLGGRNNDLQASLGTLDRCIAALRSSGIDDMDFSLRYATLIEKHVARFRAQFILPHSLSTSEFGDTHMNTTGFSFSPGPNFPQQVMGVSDNNGGNEHDNVPEGRMAYGDDWLARPLDPSIAPFPSDGEGISLGIGLDSLDFLWSLPSMGGE